MNSLMMRKQNGEGILSITFINYYLSYSLSFQNFFEPHGLEVESNEVFCDFTFSSGSVASHCS